MDSSLKKPVTIVMGASSTLRIFPPLTTLEIPMACIPNRDYYYYIPPTLPGERIEIENSSLRLVNVSVNEWIELWERLTMKFAQITLQEIQKVIGSLKTIKLNNSKSKFEKIAQIFPSEKKIKR